MVKETERKKTKTKGEKESEGKVKGERRKGAVDSSWIRRAEIEERLLVE